MLTIRRITLCALLLTLCAACRAEDPIAYMVSPHMAEKTLQITMRIPRAQGPIVRVQIPVWMPGAYFVGNFTTNIGDVSASDAGGKSLRLFHPDPNTWEIETGGASVVNVKYSVHNADLEEANGAPRRAHISGPRSYMYVVGRKAEPTRLTIFPPAGLDAWKTICSLDPAVDAAGKMQIPSFSAPTYDVMADAPVEMGDYSDAEFIAGGRPHHVLLYGQYSGIDKTKLTDYCKRIATEETAFFGYTPFKRYVFEFRATDGQSRGAGGLEHLGSTEIGTISTVDDRLRSVIAHEYFHLWNVKRIRPFVLGPFNYVDPPHTANLWWSEGVTSYYGDLLSERAGLNTHEEYFKHLGDTIAQLQNNTARLRVSADESSYRVWEANNSSGYGGLSYYTKGELVGLCLDLKIRNATAGRSSLDDVMRALFAQVKRGDGPGFQEDDIEKTINRVTGQDLTHFYDSAARSTDELPFDECLAYAGLKLTRLEPPKQQGDSGMRTQFDRAQPGLTVVEITPDGAAATAGLKVGDRITAVNGASEGRGLGGAIAAARPGDRISLTVSRGGASMQVELVMGSRGVYAYTVTADPAATPVQIRLRDAWLKGIPR